MTESFDRAAIKALIGQARNPLRHGDESDHCSVCFGSCGAWPGDRVGDEEELIAELADTALALLTALDEAERRIAAVVADGEAIRAAYLSFWGAHSSSDIARVGREPGMPDTPALDRERAALHPATETTEEPRCIECAGELQQVSLTGYTCRVCGLMDAAPVAETTESN